MNFFIILFTAIGLAMDAFAAAIAAGGNIRERRTVQALRIGGSFGLFQMIMPLVGWLLGTSFRHLITAFDHWLAFGLLTLVGFKMFREAWRRDECVRDERPLTNRRLLLLSLATSIDALVIGVSFAFIYYPILTAAVIIGLVTFLISAVGVLIGSACCCLWGKRAELAGGVILILIGLKILIEHLYN